MLETERNDCGGYMDNIFTPEEANMAVTYGELSKILIAIIEELSKNFINDVDTIQERSFETMRKLTDSLVKICDDIDYKRQRDMHFVLGLISQFNLCDKDILHKEYIRWCAEFDELNKQQNDSEDANG